ncbi:MAG TPA: glycosyltransferase family 4 protein, partial [Solirubrobacteraceae bacterium]
MAVALLTNNLVPYRTPLYERLAADYGVEVLCWGGGRYLPPWFGDLDAQLQAARFPARRIHGAADAFRAGWRFDSVITTYAGGPILPAAYAGARAARHGFVLWASVWAQPRSLTHDLATPVTRWIYRHADALVAYGEHARRFAAGIRGRDDDIFIAPQSVEPDVFRREVSGAEVAEFRAARGIPDGPVILYAGRLVSEKGIDVLACAWPRVTRPATLVVIGDGPLRARLQSIPGVAVLGAVAREALPVAYRLATATVVPSVPTPRFREPWALVCNESLHQGTPVIATSAVGAVAGGLVRDGHSGLVVAPGDAGALAAAVDRLLSGADLAARLGENGRQAAAAYTYEAMAAAFGRALALARR